MSDETATGSEQKKGRPGKPPGDTRTNDERHADHEERVERVADMVMAFGRGDINIRVQAEFGVGPRQAANIIRDAQGRIAELADTPEHMRRPEWYIFQTYTVLEAMNAAFAKAAEDGNAPMLAQLAPARDRAMTQLMSLCGVRPLQAKSGTDDESGIFRLIATLNRKLGADD